MAVPSSCNVSFFDDHWAVVRDLLFDEYATVRIVASTVAHIDLVNDVEMPSTTVYAVHNAQVRLVCKAFRRLIDAKSSERVRRREPTAEYIHGRFVYSDRSE